VRMKHLGHTIEDVLGFMIRNRSCNVLDRMLSICSRKSIAPLRSMRLSSTEHLPPKPSRTLPNIRERRKYYSIPFFLRRLIRS